MKRHSLMMLLAAALLLATGTALAAPEAPDFTLGTVDDEQITLSEYEGQVVLVNFWATWCPPCRAEIPHFVELVEERGGDGLVILGLSADRGGEGVVKKWLADNPVNYPIAMADGELIQQWQQFVPQQMRGGIPFSFVIDREGVIQHVIVGYRDKGQWLEMIEPLL